MGMSMSAQEQREVDLLVQAARDGDVDAVKRGMLNANGRDSAHNTPLLVACMFGRVEVVDVLLSAGGGLEIDPRDENETTPLMSAAGGGFLEIVVKLLKAGADFRVKDRLGWSAVHHAAASGHANVVSYLVSKGCSPFDRDSAGCSPLWLAANCGDPETVRVLLLYGADPDESNDEDVAVLDAVEGDPEDDDPEADATVIRRMIETASFAWADAREKLEGGDAAPAADKAAKAKPHAERRDPRVLKGIDEPSVPVTDDYYRVNDPDEDEEDDEIPDVDDDVPMYRLRREAVALLRVEDAFVENYDVIKAGIDVTGGGAGAAGAGAKSKLAGESHESEDEESEIDLDPGHDEDASPAPPASSASRSPASGSANRAGRGLAEVPLAEGGSLV